MTTASSSSSESDSSVELSSLPGEQTLHSVKSSIATTFGTNLSSFLSMKMSFFGVFARDCALFGDRDDAFSSKVKFDELEPFDDLRESPSFDVSRGMGFSPVSIQELKYLKK